MNASSILSTMEYSNESTRGTSNLTINPDGTDKIISSGLDKSYITEYSYGLLETLNLFIPRFLGVEAMKMLVKIHLVMSFYTEWTFTYRCIKSIKTNPYILG